MLGIFIAVLVIYFCFSVINVGVLLYLNKDESEIDRTTWEMIIVGFLGGFIVSAIAGYTYMCDRGIDDLLEYFYRKVENIKNPFHKEK
jgi:H+/Cl- antiporter ClcA